jgi:cell division protein FtsW
LIITLQAVVNMAVSVGLMPVTGQPLPLISMGGSSVFFTCIAIGMILGVSRESEREEAQQRKQLAEENRMNNQAVADIDTDYEEQ